MEVKADQRSPEWYAARCGSLGASQIADALAKTKSGWGAGRKNAKAQLVAERLSGRNVDTYINGAMQRGIDMEGEARDYYAFMSGNDVIECGLFKHPTIDGTHASPDGLIDDDGLLEIKVPNIATHIEYLEADKMPGKYFAQIQWQMACAQREWTDFISYCEYMPEDLKMFRIRVNRDDEYIKMMEKDVTEFLAEVDEAVARLTNRKAA